LQQGGCEELKINFKVLTAEVVSLRLIVYSKEKIAAFAQARNEGATS